MLKTAKDELLNCVKRRGVFNLLTLNLFKVLLKYIQ